nr:hypothetical protein CFP56_31509 [Quercus suber]
MPGTVCSCGKLMFDSRGLCLACLELQQERPSRQFVLPDRTASPTTPPFMQSPQPQDCSRQSRSSHRRQPSATQALDSAFASPRQTARISPDSLYDGQSRKASPRASPPNALGSMYRATSIPPPRQGSLPAQAARQVTPDAVPTIRPDAASSRSYSPMAAGFARLNRSSETSRRFGSVSDRGGLDLEARMFDGPA